VTPHGDGCIVRLDVGQDPAGRAGDGALRADSTSVDIDLRPVAAATFTIDEGVEWPLALGQAQEFDDPSA